MRFVESFKMVVLCSASLELCVDLTFQVRYKLNTRQMAALYLCLPCMLQIFTTYNQQKHHVFVFGYTF
jgi:hypothetical protein